MSRGVLTFPGCGAGWQGSLCEHLHWLYFPLFRQEVPNVPGNLDR